MDLRIWHSTTFEPAVKDFLDSSEFSLPLLAFNGQMVDVLSVQICDFHSSQLL